MTTFITRYETAVPVSAWPSRTSSTWRVSSRRRVVALWRTSRSGGTGRGLPAGGPPGGARIVGRTNLHELALGVTGVNQWYGTPVNPLDPPFPGGSSSGSAVAVATGEADVGSGVTPAVRSGSLPPAAARRG